MIIRNATESDINEILKIYEFARKYMVEKGNPNQWSDGYPDEAIIKKDIQNGNSFLVDEDGEILGVFVFIVGEEPTYQVIEQGNWSSNKKYGTIHRIASSGTKSGITKYCFDYCAKKIDYLRIDTHENNKSMQRAIQQYGFKKCGIISVRNGKRIAFDYIADEHIDKSGEMI